MTAICVCILGRKGGTGKSTLTVSLAGALAKAKRRVLIVDLDGQGSSSRAFFGPAVCDSRHPLQTSAAFFAGANPEPIQIIQTTSFDGLDIVLSNQALDSFMQPHVDCDLSIVAPFIDEVGESYDVILIDTAPNTDAWPTLAALAASDWAISPIIPDAYGAQSTSDTLYVVEHAPHVSFLGFVLSMVERNAVTSHYVNAIRKHHGGDIFKTEIPKAVAFREAIASRTPPSHLKPKCAAAKAIDALANEIGARTCERRRRVA